MVACLQAQPVRIGAGQALGQKLPNERVRHLGVVGAGSAAVDDPLCLELLHGTVPAPPAHLEPVLPWTQADQATGRHLEDAGPQGSGYGFGDWRRHAVAMDVPPGPDVADEAASFRGRKLAPEQLHMRPERVDHAAPVDTGSRRPAHLAPYRLEQRGQGPAIVRIEAELGPG
jgi:hypothetical protein